MDSLLVALFVGLIICYILIYCICRKKESYTHKPKSRTLSPQSETAAALRTEGITLYGREGCPYCANQASEFGDAFSEVDYVDCGKNPEKCAGLKGVPAWMKNGKMIQSGYLSLSKIREKLGM